MKTGEQQWEDDYERRLAEEAWAEAAKPTNGWDFLQTLIGCLTVIAIVALIVFFV